MSWDDAESITYDRCDREGCDSVVAMDMSGIIIGNSIYCCPDCAESVLAAADQMPPQITLYDPQGHVDGSELARTVDGPRIFIPTWGEAGGTHAIDQIRELHPWSFPGEIDVDPEPITMSCARADCDSTVASNRSSIMLGRDIYCSPDCAAAVIESTAETPDRVAIHDPDQQIDEDEFLNANEDVDEDRLCVDRKKRIFSTEVTTKADARQAIDRARNVHDPPFPGDTASED